MVGVDAAGQLPNAFHALRSLRGSLPDAYPAAEDDAPLASGVRTVLSPAAVRFGLGAAFSPNVPRWSVAAGFGAAAAATGRPKKGDRACRWRAA
ncbi:MAG: hypothetical protein R3F36_08275 [Candidatus Competibacteraceae bacterium]